MIMKFGRWMSRQLFLNDNLEESIYITQLEGFIDQDQEQKVCKIQKSIYGLKQTSRS